MPEFHLTGCGPSISGLRYKNLVQPFPVSLGQFEVLLSLWLDPSRGTQWLMFDAYPRAGGQGAEAVIVATMKERPRAP